MQLATEKKTRHPSRSSERSSPSNELEWTSKEIGKKCTQEVVKNDWGELVTA